MKKKNSLYFIFGFFIFVGFVGLLFVMFKNEKLGSDFKIGILAEDGVALVSFSKERKMINVLKVDPEAKLWIPGGLGWYRNEVIKKVLKQEKQLDLLDDILFYNFGYKADKLLYLEKTDDWKNVYWWKLGLSNNFFNKEELVTKDVDLSDDFLDEVMIRDFAETKVINEDLKLSIINMTEISGLAGFMTKRFERLGFSVISIGNENSQIVSKCQILYGQEATDTYSLSLIKNLIKCEAKEDNRLNRNEIEIYFDDNFSSMIKYPSYKK